MRLLLCLLFAFSAVSAFGHSDPRGEKHPVVLADNQGNFRVFFDYSDQDFQGAMSLLLAEDGRELIPRHRLSPGALKAFGILEFVDPFSSGYRFPGTGWCPVQITLEPAEKDRCHFVLRERLSGDGSIIPAPIPGRVLPFDPIPLQDLAEWTATADHLAFVTCAYPDESTASTQNESYLPSTELFLRGCPRRGGTGGVQVRLAHVATIYDSARTSAPVWASGRFWIAWIRQEGTEAKPAWTTVLTGLDPVTGIAESHDLPGISNWNTSLALTANAHDTLCAAWAASVDGSYPGRARVVTAVFPLKPVIPPWR